MNSLSGNSNAATQMLVFSTDADPLRVLADVPPFIPGYKSLANNVSGVNRNMVNSDRRGLLGYIFPYSNMDSTDEVRLYLGPRPTPVGEFFLVGKYVDQLVPFYIPAVLLEQLYASPVPMPDARSFYFSVKRPSENEKNSPPLPLLYKPFGPGELDTPPDLPNNQGLLPPDPSKTVIDKQVMEKGMSVTVPQYKHQAIGDVVYLAVGPRELTMTVTELGDLWFELTPEFLATLPNTDKVVLTYEIWDIVDNGSGWSLTVFLTLKPTEKLLTLPVIDEAEPGNPDNLKHDALNGETATVLLNEQFIAGDEVLLTIALSTAVGDRVERVLPLEVENSTRSLRINLENEFIQNGIRGSMILSYTRQRAGTTLHSESYSVTISGLALPAPPPTVTEQTGDELPADTELAHVQIPKYWPLAAGATVQLCWQVTGSDGVIHLYIFGQIINDVSQEIIFTVGSEYIERFADSPLTALYKIENPGKSLVQSGSLQLTIGKAVTLAPVIDAVKDADTNALITNGGGTNATRVTMTGTASPNETLVIFNGATPIDTIQASAHEHWSYTFPVLASQSYQMTVEAQSGGKPTSQPWTFTVWAKLQIGGNLSINLTDYFQVAGRPPSVIPDEATCLQQASGGSGRYTYESSNQNVARVISADGRVGALGNGTTTITVSDGSQSASYQLTVTGIRYARLRQSHVNWTDGSWRQSCLTVAQFQRFWGIYSLSGNVATYLGWPNSRYWTSTNNDYVGNVAWAFTLADGKAFELNGGQIFYPTIEYA
ncbi:Ig-like domain-containing protein [Pseudomonas sp. RT4P38]